MSREEIIGLAREAGFLVASASLWVAESEALERFADLVAAAEREACAVLVERGMGDFLLGKKIAAAIRARGEE